MFSSIFAKAMVAIAALLAPIKAVMLTVGFLVFVDMIFGVVAALKRKEKFESNKMGRTVIKMLIYQLAIITAFAVESTIIPELPVTRIAAAAIGLTEFQSLLENFKSITGVDIWQKVLQLQSRKEEKK